MGVGSIRENEDIYGAVGNIYIDTKSTLRVSKKHIMKDLIASPLTTTNYSLADATDQARPRITIATSP